MRAWQLIDSKLKLREIPQPIPGKGEVLIRVRAAGVIPAELAWYPTTRTKAGNARPAAVPGHEFSGTVSALGIDATGANVGDEVFGMNDWFCDGATADYCITRPQWICAKPKALTHIQAASVPISALTAWQALFDHAKLQSGERVLIHGGSGSVGLFAIQFAKRCGAHITTTASARSTPLLRELGAERVIDYHTEQFEKLLTGIDVVLDTVGGETLQRSWSVLAPTGRLISVASDSQNQTDERSRKAFFIVEPKQDQLSLIAQQVDSGAIQAFVDTVVQFESADQAYSRQINQRLGRGNVIVEVNGNKPV